MRYNREQLQSSRLFTPSIMSFHRSSRRRGILLASAFLSVLSIPGLADTVVTLSSGQRMTGTFVDATSTMVRPRDQRGIAEEIPLNQVTTIEFHKETQPAVPPVEQKPGSPESLIPQQHDFCMVLGSYRAASLHSSSASPIAQAQTRSNATDPLSSEPKMAEAFGANAHFTKWVGTTAFGVFNQSVVIRFVPDCPEAVDVADFANASQRPFLPAAVATTVLSLDSPIARQLSSMRAKSRIVVSGNLVTTPRDPNFPRSWYKPQPRPKFMNNASGPATGATVARPHYLVQFSAVEPIPSDSLNQTEK
jgi:hypothetical protein